MTQIVGVSGENAREDGNKSPEQQLKLQFRKERRRRRGKNLDNGRRGRVHVLSSPE